MVGAQQVAVRLTRRVPTWTATELAVIRVGTHLWGGTPSSPLFAAMRTSGLAYAPWADIALSPVPRWWVSFSCSPATVDPALTALSGAVRDGASCVPPDRRGWNEAVDLYEQAVAMSRLRHEVTIQRLVDRALADAPPTDDVRDLRAVGPRVARQMWAAFLDLAQMDLVAVTPPGLTISSTHMDSSAPARARLSPHDDYLLGSEHA